MIDKERVAVMSERLDVTEGLYAKMSEKYCLILDNLISLKNQINGHPEETLRLLEETTCKIQEIQSSLNFSRSKTPLNNNVKWWEFFLFFIICIIGSAVGHLLFSFF